MAPQGPGRATSSRDWARAALGAQSRVQGGHRAASLGKECLDECVHESLSEADTGVGPVYLSPRYLLTRKGTVSQAASQPAGVLALCQLQVGPWKWKEAVPG